MRKQRLSTIGAEVPSLLTHSFPPGPRALGALIRVAHRAGAAPAGLAEILAEIGCVASVYEGAPPPPRGATVYLLGEREVTQVNSVLTDEVPEAAVIVFGSMAPGCTVPAFLLPPAPPPELLRNTILAAVEVVRCRKALNSLWSRLEESEGRLERLNRIGIALSAERDMGTLLERILTESRRFSGSRAGTLYLVDEEDGRPLLRAKLAQNDDVTMPLPERGLEISECSLAGYVAMHGEPLAVDDAYAIYEGAPYRHNTALDQATGWRTRSVLVVPMKDHRGELVGVMQLMNRLSPGGRQLSYEPELVPLLLSLATQAAVLVQANRLTESVRRLFVDFTRASIVAMEQRDPTTAGHSQRVMQLSVALAEVTDRADDGPYKDVRFSREELHEISIAALLHDFGKISVPERVLVKAKKLEAHEMRCIRDRFDLAMAVRERDSYRAAILEQVRGGVALSREVLEQLERRAIEEEQEMAAAWEAVVMANEPTVLKQAAGERIREIRGRCYRDRSGHLHPLLSDEEFRFLSIDRGSLDETERRIIESHVSHTFRFLSSIPWTPELRRVPEFAYGHHERLDGSGYPRRIAGPEIPLQARLLAVCDIYDALTASDRPYKKAVPRDQAIHILQLEAGRGLIDSWLVQAFIEAKVYLRG